MHDLLPELRYCIISLYYKADETKKNMHRNKSFNVQVALICVLSLLKIL